jgi:hypothetical protein
VNRTGATGELGADFRQGQIYLFHQAYTAAMVALRPSLILNEYKWLLPGSETAET